MFSVRKYKPEDFSLLSSWWSDWGLNPAWKELLPEDMTFIVENDNTPVASACLYLIVNVPHAAMIEHLISDASVPSQLRQEAVAILVSYLEDVAVECGYKSLVCFGYVDKVKERYKDLGYSETLNNVSTFSKSLRS